VHVDVGSIDEPSHQLFVGGERTQTHRRQQPWIIERGIEWHYDIVDGNGVVVGNQKSE